jgi:hypothetical protein
MQYRACGMLGSAELRKLGMKHFADFDQQRGSKIEKRDNKA